MKEPILKNYYVMITDAWQLLKKYSAPVDNDEFWKSMTEEANEMHIRHGEVDFSEKILGLVMDELNEIGRKK